MSIVPLKKCAHPDCDREFPEHYFADKCPKHSDDDDRALSGDPEQRGPLYDDPDCCD